MDKDVAFESVERNEIVEEVSSSVKFTAEYFIILVLSVIIATLGLLLGNTAIIIGSMILSPMMWPIIGVSVGTVTSRNRMFARSVAMLIASIVVSVTIAYLISQLSPFAEVNNEIALRGNPTFLDLIIALAAGIAAILIISWPRYSNQLAGVAVSASILPPICVTGIGLALGIQEIAIGSFILFLTNLASIIFVGIALFTVMGLHVKNNKTQRKKIEVGLFLSYIVILVLSFQLLFSLNTIIYEGNIKSQIRKSLKEQLSQVSTGIVIDTVSISNVTRTGTSVDVQATIRVPSDIQIRIEQKNRIVESLGENLGKKVNLEFQIIPILKVVTEEKKGEQKKEDEATHTIQSTILEDVSNLSDNYIVEKVQVSKDESGESLQDGEPVYDVEAIIRVPESDDFTEEDKQDIEDHLIDVVGSPVQLTFTIIRYERL